MTKCQLCRKPIDDDGSDDETHAACTKLRNDRLAAGMCTRCGRNRIPPRKDYCCTNCTLTSPFKF